jgi:hypothetical protein
MTSSQPAPRGAESLADMNSSLSSKEEVDSIYRSKMSSREPSTEIPVVYCGLRRRGQMNTGHFEHWPGTPKPLSLVTHITSSNITEKPWF